MTHTQHILGDWFPESTVEHRISRAVCVQVRHLQRPAYPRKGDRPACCVDRCITIEVVGEVGTDRDLRAVLTTLEKLVGSTRPVVRTGRHAKVSR